MRFRPEQHLRRPGDFRTVREQGRRIDCGAFTCWWLARGDHEAPARLGVVASYAQVGAAVARARAKRRLREIFRRHQECVPAGHDLILSARRAVNVRPFPELEQRFIAACRQFSTAHA